MRRGAPGATRAIVATDASAASSPPVATTVEPIAASPGSWLGAGSRPTRLTVTWRAAGGALVCARRGGVACLAVLGAVVVPPQPASASTAIAIAQRAVPDDC